MMKFGKTLDLELAQFLGALVQQQNGEDLVIDDSADELGNAAARRVQVERGGP